MDNMQKYIRLTLNNIFFHLNRYNIFGGILAYLVADRLSAITSDSKKFLKNQRHLYSILMIIIFFIVVKEVVKLVMDYPEVCECAPKEKTIMQELEECGSNEDIIIVITDVFKTLGKHGWEFIYEYNFIGLLFVLLLGSLSGVIYRTNNLTTLYTITFILISLVSVKHLFKILLKSQDFCPCHCKKYKCVNNLSSTNIGNEIITEIKNNKNEGPTLKDKLGNSYDYYKELEDDLNELEQNLENEAERRFQEQYDQDKKNNKDLENRVNDSEKLKSKNAKLPSDDLVDKRIAELCGKNQPFKVLDTDVNPEKCLSIINNNKILKNFITGMLKDKSGYSCLQNSNSSTAINSCINDYVVKQPKMAEKIVGDYLEVEIKELENLIEKNYPQYVKKNEKKGSKTVSELEKKVNDLKKVVENKTWKHISKMINPSELKKKMENVKENFFFSLNNKTENFRNYEYQIDTDESVIFDSLETRIDNNCKKNPNFYIPQEGETPLFTDVKECVNYISNNSYLRNLFKNILMEKSMYRCVLEASNQTNMNECLMRYFTDYPVMLQKVINLKKISKGKDIVTQKDILIRFKKMLKEDYDYVNKVNDSIKSKFQLNGKISESEKVKLEQPLHERGTPKYNDPYNFANIDKLEMPVFGDDYPQKTSWPPSEQKISTDELQRRHNDKILGL
jgi:hypothetical protein